MSKSVENSVIAVVIFLLGGCLGMLTGFAISANGMDERINKTMEQYHKRGYLDHMAGKDIYRLVTPEEINYEKNPDNWQRIQK